MHYPACTHLHVNMEHTLYEGYGQARPIPSATLPERRKSLDGSQRQGPRHLQKKRPDTKSPAFPRQNAPDVDIFDQLDSLSAEQAMKMRKGSLRYAVRRIFGRRSRDVEDPPSPASPPRADSIVADSIPVESSISSEDPTPSDDAVQRTLSAPVSILPQPGLRRSRSPYQFPHSASLKPLALGNPYTAPGSRLKRRKSLPSVLVSESEAAALSMALASPRTPMQSSPDASHELPPDVVEITSRRERRRSRSVDDLLRSACEAPLSPQSGKREMRQWRESFQYDVLRASGFTTRSPVAAAQDQRHEDDAPPSTPRTSPKKPKRSIVTPPLRQDASIKGTGATSTVGTEASRDLEDRVATLEAGVHTFRGQLAQLSADRRRGTARIGESSPESVSSRGGRSASELAKDLQQDLPPSDYQYERSRPVRTTASPPRRSPVTPTRANPSTLTPPLSSCDPPGNNDPFVSPIREATNKALHVNTCTNFSMPQYTFRSLYEMLADERSARRRLETEMKALRAEVASLHDQLSQQADVRSERSIYHAAVDPMVGSSRLHAMLQGTESPASTVQSHTEHESGEYRAARERLTSRFSRSESELGYASQMEAEELHTPYDEYRTPMEEFYFFTPRPSDDETF